MLLVAFDVHQWMGGEHSSLHLRTYILCKSVVSFLRLAFCHTITKTTRPGQLILNGNSKIQLHPEPTMSLSSQ